MTLDTSIFKSYDIRGIYGQSLDEELSEKIGRGFAKYLNFPKQVIVGRDGRVSGKSMKEALIIGLTKVGVNVIDIDLASTDMFYFACQKYGLPGITVTASHNPKDYTGFKMVEKIPKLLSGEAGIKEIREYIEQGTLPPDSETIGTISPNDVLSEFTNYALSLIDNNAVKPFKIFADSANGMVGPILNLISQKIPQINLVPMYWDIDGNFPNHGGDPLEFDNQTEIKKRITSESGDFGVMFDPDGDRFFVVDKQGRFIPGDFITALLGEYFIKRYPGCGVVYDVISSRVVSDTISRCGGKAYPNQVGHTHIKARMSQEGAYFGGEISGHYYFKDFYLCDSGTISFAYFLDYVSKLSIPFDQIIDELLSRYHISPVVNSEVNSVTDSLAKVESFYGPLVISPIIRMDGLSFEMGDWRFNVRGSNTQPLLRLSLEASTHELMEQKRDEVLKLIRGS